MNQPTTDNNAGKHTQTLCIDSLATVERQYILYILHALNYNRTATAKALKIGIRTLQRKLHKWGLSKVGMKDHSDSSSS